MALSQDGQLIVCEGIWVRNGIVSRDAGIRVVGEEEPVPKLESIELLPNNATKCGTNVCFIFDILCQTPSEQVYVTRGIIQVGKHLPSVTWYVARWLIPRAGCVQATFLESVELIRPGLFVCMPLLLSYLSPSIISRQAMVTAPLNVACSKISSPKNYFRVSGKMIYFDRFTSKVGYY